MFTLAEFYLATNDQRLEIFHKNTEFGIRGQTLYDEQEEDSEKFSIEKLSFAFFREEKLTAQRLSMLTEAEWMRLCFLCDRCETAEDIYSMAEQLMCDKTFDSSARIHAFLFLKAKNQTIDQDMFTNFLVPLFINHIKSTDLFDIFDAPVWIAFLGEADKSIHFDDIREKAINFLPKINAWLAGKQEDHNLDATPKDHIDDELLLKVFQHFINFKSKAVISHLMEFYINQNKVDLLKFILSPVQLYTLNNDLTENYQDDALFYTRWFDMRPFSLAEFVLHSEDSRPQILNNVIDDSESIEIKKLYTDVSNKINNTLSFDKIARVIPKTLSHLKNIDWARLSLLCNEYNHQYPLTQASPTRLDSLAKIFVFDNKKETNPKEKIHAYFFLRARNQITCSPKEFSEIIMPLFFSFIENNPTITDQNGAIWSLILSEVDVEKLSFDFISNIDFAQGITGWLLNNPYVSDNIIEKILINFIKSESKAITAELAIFGLLSNKLKILQKTFSTIQFDNLTNDLKDEQKENLLLLFSFKKLLAEETSSESRVNIIQYVFILLYSTLPQEGENLETANKFIDLFILPELLKCRDDTVKAIEYNDFNAIIENFPQLKTLIQLHLFFHPELTREEKTPEWTNIAISHEADLFFDLLKNDYLDNLSKMTMALYTKMKPLERSPMARDEAGLSAQQAMFSELKNILNNKDKNSSYLQKIQTKKHLSIKNIDSENTACQKALALYKKINTELNSDHKAVLNENSLFLEYISACHAFTFADWIIENLANLNASQAQLDSAKSNPTVSLVNPFIWKAYTECLAIEDSRDLQSIVAETEHLYDSKKKMQLVNDWLTKIFDNENAQKFFASLSDNTQTVLLEGTNRNIDLSIKPAESTPRRSSIFGSIFGTSDKSQQKGEAKTPSRRAST